MDEYDFERLRQDLIKIGIIACYYTSIIENASKDDLIQYAEESNIPLEYYKKNEKQRKLVL